MKLIYEPATYRELPASMQISPADDAWHPLRVPNYVEWWYFDVMCADGALVRGQFFIAGDVSRPRKVSAGVRCSYVLPDGREMGVEKRFPFTSFMASEESCNVAIAKSSIQGDPSGCRLHMEDGDTALELETQSALPGFVSHACFGGEENYMYWAVPQPRGPASGTFRHGGKSYAIEGTAYRDHNWLSFLPLGILDYWDWGRIYGEGCTVLFADIVTTGKLGRGEVKPLLVFDSVGLTYMTTDASKWGLEKSGYEVFPEVSERLPRRLLLKADDDGFSLSADLTLQRTFQRIDLLADFNPLARFLVRLRANPRIVSCCSSGPGILTSGGLSREIPLSAVHELVDNRRSTALRA